MALEYLINSARNFRSLFSGRTGNNSVAFLNDVNNLIDQLNGTRNYDEFNEQFTSDGTLNPTFNISGGPGSLPTDVTACRKGTCLNTYNTGAITYQACGACHYASARLSPGVYNIVFIETPAYGYDVYLSPPVINGTRVSIVKEIDRFVITTTDAAGVPTDGLLTGMSMTLKMYYRIKVPLK
jgi:hypothetical protein